MTPPNSSPAKPAKRDKVVCRCLGVTESRLVEAIESCEIHTVEDVVQHTQAGDGCTACHPLIRRYLKKLGRDCEDPCADPCRDGKNEPGWASL